MVEKIKGGYDEIPEAEARVLQKIGADMAKSFGKLGDIVADLKRQGKNDSAYRFIATVLVSAAQGLGEVSGFELSFKDGTGLTVEVVPAGKG